MVGIAASARTCDVAREADWGGGGLIAKLGLSHTYRQKSQSLKQGDIPWLSTYVIIVIISLNDDQEWTLQVIVQTVFFLALATIPPTTISPKHLSNVERKIFVMFCPFHCYGSCTEYTEKKKQKTSSEASE